MMKNYATKFVSCLLLIVLLANQVVTLKAGTRYINSILDKPENKSESPLIEPIRKNDAKKITDLIKSGCNVNEKDECGRTPLMAAAYKGNTEIIKLLVAAGSEIQCYDNSGDTPIMFALYDIQKEAAVKYFVSLKVDIEVMNSQERTPLILAALNNHHKSIKLLLEAGAKLETKGEKGATALMASIENSSFEAAQLLIQNGANIETKDDWGCTPLMLASFHNQGMIIRILIKAGANVNVKTAKDMPVSISKDFFEWPPKTVNIPKDSTALAIAKQFENRYAQNILITEGQAQ